MTYSTTFKAGDRVRVIAAHYADSWGDQDMVVEGTVGDWCILCKHPRLGTGGFSTSELRRASTDLKAGDRVRCIDAGNQRGLVTGREYVPDTVESGSSAWRMVTTSEGYRGKASRFELVTVTFKPGDKVRVVRKGRSNEPGFSNTWLEEMDQVVRSGVTYEVRSVGAAGVYFKAAKGPASYAFPPSCLELVTEPVAPVDGKIDLASLKVGDKVTIQTVVEVTDELDCDGDVRVRLLSGYDASDGYLWGKQPPVGTVERAPRPLAVDDAVLTKGGTRGVIKSLFEDRATVKLAHGSYTTRLLADLIRA